MPWSITVGRFGGTAVKIHITFFLFLAWIAASAWAADGARAALDSAAVHHPPVPVRGSARVRPHRRRPALRHPVAEVTLLPIGGVASMPRLPSDPRQELVVALAGPAVNLVIGAALVLALGSLRPGDLQRIDDPHLSLLGRLAAANLFLAAFNLIPAFPMDGGRVLHALLAMRLGGPLATEIAAKVGQAFAIGLGFLGLFGNPLLLFIAIFVYMAAAGEAQMSAAQQALKGLTVGEAMETRFTPIAVDATLGQAVDALIAAAQHEFPVVDAFRKPIGLIDAGGHPLGRRKARAGRAGRRRDAGRRGQRPSPGAGRGGVRTPAGPEGRRPLRHRPGRRDRRALDPAGAGRDRAHPFPQARLAIRSPDLRLTAPGATNMAAPEERDHSANLKSLSFFALAAAFAGARAGACGPAHVQQHQRPGQRRARLHRRPGVGQRGLVEPEIARLRDACCAGALAAQFYYVYAMDERGGEWKGKAFMCTSRPRVQDPGAAGLLRARIRPHRLLRGRHRQGRQSWTVQLTDQANPSTP